MKIKKLHLLAVAAIALLLSGLSVSCNSGSDKTADVYFTVSYETDHGTPPETKSVLEGTVLTENFLPELTAEGYDFEGWYIAAIKITEAFKYTVKSDVILSAKWTEKAAEPSQKSKTAPEAAELIFDNHTNVGNRNEWLKLVMDY